MSDPFAIITFRDDGPLKSWSAVRGANVHNARTKPIEHAVPGAPPPEHLIGRGDLVADVKRLLKSAKLDPHCLRSNGVICYEAIMTASPEFFEQGEPAAREQRLREWVDAQVEFATKRWGRHRVASMVLHLDEKTPHIHLVVLPLEVKADGRRRDAKEMRWSLVGSTISGPGKFDRLQDDYAAGMAPFGLVRGIAGSGRKHEPQAVYLHRIATREREAKERDEAARAAQVEAERQTQTVLRMQHLISLERDEVAEARSVVDGERRAAASEQIKAERLNREAEDRGRAIAAEAVRVEAARAELLVGADELDTRRAQMDREKADMDAERRALAAEREALAREKREQQQLVATARMALDEAWRVEAALAPIFAEAAAFKKSIDVLGDRVLPATTMDAYRAADRVRAASERLEPANDQSARSQAVIAAVRQQAQAIGM